jgi:uncharacterized membrane protein required for colicin V production
MDLVGAIRGAPLADLAIFGSLFAAFVVGVLQGSIRRLLGVASILLAFLLAANLRGAFGQFLADNWRQFSLEYSELLAFLMLFVALAVAFSVVIQGFYKRTDIYAAHPVVDDVVGGLLGLLEGFVVVTVLIIIFNSHVPPDKAVTVSELDGIQDALLNHSQIAAGIRDNIVPPLIHLIGGLLPSDLTSLYP